jgi:protein-S-isoprenylcysteine O-methyltransferase Ste14
MQLIFVALRSALCAAAFVSLWAWVALLLRPLDRNLGGPLPSWVYAPGIVLLCAGGALAGSCIVAFAARGRGTPAPFDPPRRFVAVGPYRVVRNPMYIGGALLLLGFGLIERSPAIVLLVPAWWLLFHLFVLFYEEPVLRAKFGREYEDYCRRTSRWIPRGAILVVDR